MKVVIAGGSGFIGRPLCRELFNDGGNEILVLTRKDARATVPYATVVTWAASIRTWQACLKGRRVNRPVRANVAGGR